MGEPPVEGVVKATDSVPFPGVISVMCGAPGTVTGVPSTILEIVPRPY